MGIFDAINVAEGALSVHRYRSEVAAQNVANAYDPDYRAKRVKLTSTDFGMALNGAQAGIVGGGSLMAARSVTSGDMGAVRVAATTTEPAREHDERQQAFLGVTEMMRAKGAFDLNVKSAGLLKSMALSSLEIGRGA